MMHGPCGYENPKLLCMVKGQCSKYFSKKFCMRTSIDENGFAIYRRRDDGRHGFKNGVILDNRFVVPYILDLLIRYQAHINVEWCNKSKMIKYLFKYINKGVDRTRAIIADNVVLDGQTGETRHKQVDEIKMYLDCRYLSAYEAVWRIFQFDIHFREPTVERLVVHLSFMNKVVYPENQSLPSILIRKDIGKTMLTEWMLTNQMFDDARDLTYAEFPTKWV